MTQSGYHDQEMLMHSSAARWKKYVSMSAVALTWASLTYLFWVGYAGADDMFYARYAFLFHRPPINWWEFRMPEILAMRGLFLLFGPSEFAAALPSLLASLAMLASVAWLVEWPGRLNWQTNAAMILAATLPLDVGFRSWPAATNLAGGLLVVGTVCMLKGAPRTQYIGAALFAAGFSTHEISFFYIAIFSCTAVLFDFRRFWRPVLACIILAACVVFLEAAVYKVILGDPLARFRTSATGSASTTAFAEWTGSRLRFFTWPLENLVFGKPFGFDLILLLGTGIAVWKKLAQNQRILFTATFVIWAWFGYGTIVPWSYQLLYRQFHYYGPLALGVASLLPFTIGSLLAHRKFYALATMGTIFVVHLICSAAGGRWGSNVDVSRELLGYAHTHPQEVFLADVQTMNQMYTVGGFVLPPNVVCLNGPALRHLLVNKESAGTPVFHFPARKIDGALVNFDELDSGVEPEFTNYLHEHNGRHTLIVPKRVKFLFRPLLPFMHETPFMISWQGGEVVATP
jgi:hypothetical protein